MSSCSPPPTRKEGSSVTDKRFRARQRWKLLSQALRGCQTNHDEDDFPGFGMLDDHDAAWPDTIPIAPDDVKRWIVKLSTVDDVMDVEDHDDNDATASRLAADLYDRILAILALDSTIRNVLFACSCHISSHLAAKMTAYLAKELQSCNMQVLPSSEACHGSTLLALEFVPPIALLQNTYTVQQLPGRTGVLYRGRSHLQLSLSELLSHQYQDGVDNTGNIRVWDAERTLVWALQHNGGVAATAMRPLSPPRYHDDDADNKVPFVIYELGAGMVGAAALSLVANAATAAAAADTMRPPGPTQLQVVITDGNEQCVRNNRVNVHLMRAAGRLPLHDCNVRCQVLRWSMQAEASLMGPLRADLVMVSDCTHFRHFHAELLWTLTVVTKTGGTVWMCQPQRGQTLQLFLDRVVFVNHDDRRRQPPLWQIQCTSYPKLDARHAEYLQNDHPWHAGYVPDKHRPILVRLIKLRDATSHDKAAIQAFVPPRVPKLLKTS